MNHYTTTDMALAATLMTLSIEIVSIERDWTKATFHFKNTERLKELLRNYFNNKIMVNPITFFWNIKWLKTRIYQDF